MKAKLVVIGASYLQLPLILKAREMGIETHAFAWEAGAVAKDHCDFFYPISIIEKESILKETRKIQPNGVASIGSDLAAVTVNYIANELDLIGNSLDTTTLTTNKYLMRQKLSDSGLSCPKFLLAKQDTSLEEIDLKFPVIVKPTDRSGSRGVTKVSEISEVLSAVKRALSESLKNEAIIEEFIEGQEISVEMITWEGEHHFLAITDKVTTGPPYFVETQQHQPSLISSQLRDKVLDTVYQALTCLGVTFGASHSELLITPDDNAFIVEIGARMGGDCIGSHLVQLSTGYDFVKGVIEVSLGNFQLPEKPNQGYSGIYYLTAQPGIIKQIVDRTSSFTQVVERDIFVKEGDTIQELRKSGDRLGYYIYAGSEKFVPDVNPLAIITEKP
jgi:biotin carboxylase